MTRINLVPPSELADQHLFAEFREIKMVPKSLKRSLDASKKRGETTQQFLNRIPKDFALGKGHVTFFFDKGHYLLNRYAEILYELIKRGINFNMQAELDSDKVFKNLDSNFNRNYKPTEEALTIIRNRIAEKIAMKPTWYRWTRLD